MTKQLKVGQTVRVTDPGYYYQSFYHWARENGLTKFEDGRRGLEAGTTGKVVAVAEHTCGTGRWLVGIEVNGAHYIYGEQGVELAKLTELPDVFTFLTPINTHYRMTKTGPGLYACTGSDEEYYVGVHAVEWRVAEILERLNDGVWTFVADITPKMSEVFEFTAGETSIVYTVDLRGLSDRDFTDVSWSKPYKGSVGYKVSVVKRYIKDGTWKIVKDLGDNEAKKEAFEAAKKALEAAGAAYTKAMRVYIDAENALK